MGQFTQEEALYHPSFSLMKPLQERSKGIIYVNLLSDKKILRHILYHWRKKRFNEVE